MLFIEKEKKQMLRENWNFHNDIAIPLESDARHYYGDTDRPFTKIYDADAIETGKVEGSSCQRRWRIRSLASSKAKWS